MDDYCYDKTNEHISKYLRELFEERNNLKNASFSTKNALMFIEKEISKIKEENFKIIPVNQMNNEDSIYSPNESSKVITRQEKIFLPVKEYPSFNFVGRILGPRGYTIKQFETKLDCRIMIRGKGSTRNPKQEETNLGQPNFEHLSEELHILVVVSEREDKIDKRIANIRTELTQFVEAPLNIPESQDAVKQMQLMELSILNESERQQQQQRQQAVLQQQLATMAAVPFSPTFYLDQAAFLGSSGGGGGQTLTYNQPGLESLAWPVSQQSLYNSPSAAAVVAAAASGESGIAIKSENAAAFHTNDSANVGASFFFTSPTSAASYINYGIPGTLGPLKMRAELRSHPYARPDV